MASKTGSSRSKKTKAEGTAAAKPAAKGKKSAAAAGSPTTAEETTGAVPPAVSIPPPAPAQPAITAAVAPSMPSAKAPATPPAPSMPPRPAYDDEPTVDMSKMVAEAKATVKPSRPPEPVEEPADATIVFAAGQLDEAARREREALSLKAGSKVRVRYLRELSDLHEAGSIKRIDLGWMVKGGAAQYAPVAERTNGAGALSRKAPVVTLPRDAGGELQMWFKVELDGGRVTWDSNYARNYRFPIR
ncbi:MAG: DUF6209 family protein [Myxococcota bacterium]